jgi:hypothetical protein
MTKYFFCKSIWKPYCTKIIIHSTNIQKSQELEKFNSLSTNRWVHKCVTSIQWNTVQNQFKRMIHLHIYSIGKLWTHNSDKQGDKNLITEQWDILFQRFPHRLKVDLPYNPAVALLVIYLKDRRFLNCRIWKTTVLI